MGREAREPPLTEPVIITCVFVTGTAVEVANNHIRIVGWVQMPAIGGETEERRIAVRFAMPNSVGRGLLTQLSKGVTRDGN